MNTRGNNIALSMDGHGERTRGNTLAGSLASGGLAGSARRAIRRTRAWLLAQQLPDGSWCAELEGDTILESEFILLLAYLGREESQDAQAAAAYLLTKQLPEGGWAMYPGGSVDLSGSVKAYFALKLTGHDPACEPMQRARAAILAHGGADAVNSYTRFYLALLGQISYEQCPAVPPEMMLLPKWAPIHLYSVSAWSRTIFVPLSIMWAAQPVRKIDGSRSIQELFIRAPEDWPELRCPGLPGGTGLLSWDRFFRTVDRLLKWCRRHRLTMLRGRALRAAERWMLDRFQAGNGLGSIFPPVIWSIVALRCLGYDDQSDKVLECHRQLDALMLRDEESGTLRVQPCKGPVWDTAIGLRALATGGVRLDNPAMGRAVDWLLDREARTPGDWAQTVDASPGGWCFQHRNDFYPDCDDTAMALMALSAQFAEEPKDLPHELRLFDEQTRRATQEECAARLARITAAVDRGLRWLLAMQNDDGGWGAFDRNNNRQVLCYVPFADHNAMIDPSSPDLAGRVLEALGALGRRLGDPAVDRAVGYLRRAQEPNGSWFGRWGVNYIYGTWQALLGLRAAGVAADDPAMVAGANWLLSCQQPSGGWGESPDSYQDPKLAGQGSPTASQTAWALMGLLAAGLEGHPAVTRAVQFLVEEQRDDGAWEETEFTGTGFPRVFYLRYHYYPIYFPLMALSRWAVTATASLAEAAGPELRVVAAEEKPQEREQFAVGSVQ